MRSVVRIGDVTIGDGYPTFVIAEIGVNHEGELALAVRLVNAAADAGADAVKFQTYNTEKLISMVAMRRAVSKQARQFYPWLNDSTWLRKMNKRLTLNEYRALAAQARSCGLLFLSSAWDEESVDLVEEAGAAAYKVGSGDLTHLPLLRYIASKRKPIIISTGLGELSEIRQAISTIRDVYPACPIALLHCIVSYPTAQREVNLSFIQTLRRLFSVPVGFSDHTTETDTGGIAVAAGATIIEKHFTLDKSLPGLDHAHSLDAEEFRSQVEFIRRVEAMLGTGVWQLTEVEREERKLARRSCHATCDLHPGELITWDKIAILRPATGCPPGKAHQLIGRRVQRPVKAGEAIRWRNTEPSSE